MLAGEASSDYYAVEGGVIQTRFWYGSFIAPSPLTTSARAYGG
jgi:hypothetical protein